jgi:hypothetical protein
VNLSNTFACTPLYAGRDFPAVYATQQCFLHASLAALGYQSLQPCRVPRQQRSTLCYFLAHHDLRIGEGIEKKGCCKLAFCGEQAAKDELQYFWIDTCCIDKSNNVELSEAINSMFRWYKHAKKCNVYMTDVSDSVSDQDSNHPHQPLSRPSPPPTESAPTKVTHTKEAQIRTLVALSVATSLPHNARVINSVSARL